MGGCAHCNHPRDHHVGCPYALLALADALAAAVERLPTEAWWTGAPKFVYEMSPGSWDGLLNAARDYWTARKGEHP